MKISLALLCLLPSLLRAQPPLETVEINPPAGCIYAATFKEGRGLPRDWSHRNITAVSNTAVWTPEGWQTDAGFVVVKHTNFWALTTADDFTLVMWVKPSSVSASTTIVGSEPPGPPTGLQLLYINTLNTTGYGIWGNFRDLTGASSYFENGTYCLGVDGWSCVVFVRDTTADKFRLYVNTTLISEFADMSVDGMECGLRLGDTYTGGAPLVGIIGETYVFDYAFGTVEVQQEFNRGRIGREIAVLQAVGGGPSIPESVVISGDGDPSPSGDYCYVDVYNGYSYLKHTESEWYIWYDDGSFYIVGWMLTDTLGGITSYGWTREDPAGLGVYEPYWGDGNPEASEGMGCGGGEPLDIVALDSVTGYDVTRVMGYGEEYTGIETGKVYGAYVDLKPDELATVITTAIDRAIVCLVAQISQPEKRSWSSQFNAVLLLKMYGVLYSDARVAAVLPKAISELLADAPKKGYGASMNMLQPGSCNMAVDAAYQRLKTTPPAAIGTNMPSLWVRPYSTIAYNSTNIYAGYTLAQKSQVNKFFKEVMVGTNLTAAQKQRYCYYHPTHALLFADWMYRNGSIPQAVVTVIAKRVAEQNRLFSRFSDRHIEGVTLLLTTGNLSLVNPDWIKVILHEQKADGGWGILPGMASDSHTTGLSLVALGAYQKFVIEKKEFKPLFPLPVTVLK